MGLRNVTLSLPEETLREARHAAVDKGVSLSKYVDTILREHLQRSDRYEEAKARQLAMMKKGFDLGLHDHIPWTRDELHER